MVRFQPYGAPRTHLLKCYYARAGPPGLMVPPAPDIDLQYNNIPEGQLRRRLAQNATE